MATVRKRGKSYQIDYIDPNGKRIRRSFKKKKDAVAELGKRVSLIAENRYLDIKKEYKTTLREILCKYEENYKNQPSYKQSKVHFIKEIRNYFGEDTLISNIRYLELETFRNHLRQRITRPGSILKDSSINRIMSCLRHMLNKAVEWEMIEENPFKKGKSLRLKENNKRLRYLTEDEISRLLEACTDYLRVIVVCALNTGMRKGEILGLKWDQIRNGFIYLEKTKTQNPRQIPINGALDILFKQIRKQNHITSGSSHKCMREFRINS